MASYASPAELRAEIDLDAVTEDATLQRLLNAATKTIDRFCNRPDGFVADVAASARYFHGSGEPYQWIDECTEITAVAVKDSPSDDEDDYTAWTIGTVGTTTDADVFAATGDPERPEFNRTPYTLLIVGANGSYSRFTSGTYTHRAGFRPSYIAQRGIPTVEVTARWGFADTVPDDIKEACIMQSARWFKRIRSSMADSLATTELGQLRFTKKLDPDVELILVNGRYVRPALMGR